MVTARITLASAFIALALPGAPPLDASTAPDTPRVYT
jgi:hypothetical protein